ncbi:MAG: glycosyltransferase [Patescibacteria group bacterium]
MLVSVIVPAYKKEKTIKKDIQNILCVMRSTRYKFEIIVIVDGVLDATYERALSLKEKELKVFAYQTNKGKGYAVRFGMAKSKGDLVAFIDAGMDIDANGISMLLEHMQWYKADIMIGSKRHPASKVDYPPLRRVYSFIYQMLVFCLFFLKVKDTQTGLKVFRREVLEKTLPRLVVKQFAFDIELLAVARYLGFKRIFEAPVEISWKFEDTSIKKAFFLDPQIRGIILDTLAVFYRMYILNYYHSSNRPKWKVSPELKISSARLKAV